MKKADFIKALESYPDNADILASYTVNDEDGGHSCATEVDISYYDNTTNTIIISVC